MVNDQEVESIKRNILRSLAETSDIELLNRVQAILNQAHEWAVESTQVGFRADGSPYSLAELRKEIEASQAEFEAGEYLTIKELKQESQSWK